LRQALHQLPADGLPAESLAHSPLLAAYLLAHWVLAGLQQGQGYGFPFDRPLLALARRAQEVHALLQPLKTLPPGQPWRENLPFHHLDLDLLDLVSDRPLGRTLDRMETKIQLFEQLRHIMRIAPAHPCQGLNHAGEVVDMKDLEQQVHQFAAQVRARSDFASTPAFQKMIERFFRDLKRDGRRKTGAQALGRTLRTMLADTPLVKNLQNPEYLKIILNGQSNLEALFAQIEPAAARQELRHAQQNPEKTPRALRRFIASLATPTPIKNFIENLRSNRISLS
jgi:hypothetical protein